MPAGKARPITAAGMRRERRIDSRLARSLRSLRSLAQGMVKNRYLRERHLETRTRPLGESDRPAPAAHELARDREPQPGAGAGETPVGAAIEALEHPRAIFGRNSRSQSRRPRALRCRRGPTSRRAPPYREVCTAVRCPGGCRAHCGDRRDLPIRRTLRVTRARFVFPPRRRARPIARPPPQPAPRDRPRLRSTRARRHAQARAGRRRAGSAGRGRPRPSRPGLRPRRLPAQSPRAVDGSRSEVSAAGAKRWRRTLAETRGCRSRSRPCR